MSFITYIPTDKQQRKQNTYAQNKKENKLIKTSHNNNEKPDNKQISVQNVYNYSDYVVSETVSQLFVRGS